MKFSNKNFLCLSQEFVVYMIDDVGYSPHTIASYSYTFQLLSWYAEKTLKKRSSKITLDDLSYQLICKFLKYLTQDRALQSQSLNVRIAAIRSFFQYIAPHMPRYSGIINQILSIKNKKAHTKLINYLDEKEVEALLQAPNQQTWIGCRDHCLLILAIQTGLRLSEILSLKWTNVVFGERPFIHCIGKGRKDRNAPLTKQVAKILYNWSKKVALQTDIVFPTIKVRQMSSDAVQYLVKKYTAIAAKNCPSLKEKKVTPHVFRHTMAMRLLHKKVGLYGISLCLGHENVKTTYKYLNASIELREEIMNSTSEFKTKASRYHPTGKSLAFLKKVSRLNKYGEYGEAV